MLMWMSCEISNRKKKYQDTRDNIGVESLKDKMRTYCLRWFDDIQRSP